MAGSHVVSSLVVERGGLQLWLRVVHSPLCVAMHSKLYQCGGCEVVVVLVLSIVCMVW